MHWHSSKVLRYLNMPFRFLSVSRVANEKVHTEPYVRVNALFIAFEILLLRHWSIRRVAEGSERHVAVGSYGGDSSVECSDVVFAAPGLPNAWDFWASGVCAEELPVRVVEWFILRVCGRHCMDDWFERLGVKLGNRERCLWGQADARGEGYCWWKGAEGWLIYFIALHQRYLRLLSFVKNKDEGIDSL